MHPLLFRLGPIEVHSYGALLVGGLLVATGVALGRAPRRGVRRDDVLAVAALAFGGGLLGGYLVYVATRLPEVLAQPRLLWRSPGLVFYGGLGGGALAVALYARLVRLPLHAVADLCAPVLPLGHACGRVGCLLAGCCYGRPTDLPLGVRFPAAAGLGTSPRHPVQLYEAAGLLILAGALLALARRPRRPWTLALAYLLGYAVLRFGLELLRGDAIRGFVVPHLLSVSQAIALVVGAGAAVLLALRWRPQRV